MGFRLEYRFQEGDLLRYQQTLTMLITERREKPQAGTATFESQHQVLRQFHDDTWEVELRSRLIAAEGILQQQEVPSWLQDRIATVRIDSRGAIVDAGEAPPSARLPAFPDVPVEEGSTWTVLDRTLEKPLEVTFAVQALEEVEGDRLAHLVSTAERRDTDEGLKTTVESTMAFSLEAGCLLESTTVIEMTPTTGPRMSMVLENHFLERGTAQPLDIRAD